MRSFSSDSPMHIGVIIVVGLLFPLQGARGQAKAPNDSEKRTIITMHGFKTLAQQIHDGTTATIVTFVSEAHPGFDLKGDKVMLAVTAPVLEKDNYGIHVEGVFSLKKELRGRSPELGSVKTTIPLPSLRSTDGTWRRLRALITADGQKRSLTLLALGPKDSKSILDAYFAGPYTEADVADIEALSKTLSQSAFDKIDEDAAKALLASRNPWEAYLGLV